MKFNLKIELKIERTGMMGRGKFQAGKQENIPLLTYEMDQKD
jgi:hypothetical protein